LSAEFLSCAIVLAGAAIVRGNVAGGSGGGMLLDSRVEDCPARLYTASGGTLTVEGNWALYGGGLLANDLVAVDLVGTVVFSNNHADEMGGALYLFHSSIRIEGSSEILGPIHDTHQRTHTHTHTHTYHLLMYSTIKVRNSIQATPQGRRL
jgi:hypothetical protein